VTGKVDCLVVYDLMRKPPLSRKKLREISQVVQTDEQWENSENLPLPVSIWSTPTLLWSTMLDLIYTGNEKAAWDFLKRPGQNLAMGKTIKSPRVPRSTV